MNVHNHTFTSFEKSEVKGEQQSSYLEHITTIQGRLSFSKSNIEIITFSSSLKSEKRNHRICIPSPDAISERA